MASNEPDLPEYSNYRTKISGAVVNDKKYADCLVFREALYSIDRSKLRKFVEGLIRAPAVVYKKPHDRFVRKKPPKAPQDPSELISLISFMTYQPAFKECKITKLQKDLTAIGPSAKKVRLLRNQLYGHNPTLRLEITEELKDSNHRNITDILKAVFQLNYLVNKHL